MLSELAWHSRNSFGEQGIGAASDYTRIRNRGPSARGTPISLIDALRMKRLLLAALPRRLISLRYIIDPSPTIPSP